MVRTSNKRVRSPDSWFLLPKISNWPSKSPQNRNFWPFSLVFGIFLGEMPEFYSFQRTKGLAQPMGLGFGVDFFWGGLGARTPTPLPNLAQKVQKKKSSFGPKLSLMTYGDRFVAPLNPYSQIFRSKYQLLKKLAWNNRNQGKFR